MLQEFLKKQFRHPVWATAGYAAWMLYGKMAFRGAPPVFSPGGAIGVRIGLICDQMTYEDFRSECAVVLLTPRNWRGVLERTPPDLLFCESAWSGAGDSRGCWRGQIYRNHRVAFEHRRTLFLILKRCGELRIPTVFWNKEDPTFFGDRQHDFVDTALRFDYIFTTAEECIPRYRALGHREVHLLQFGFSPRLFNPMGSATMREQAFFAGSWYQDRPERCRDMRQLFAYVREHGLPLTIFDRNSGRKGSGNRFPEEFRTCVKPSVPFSELSALTKQYLYAVNVNTVKDSKTMFARRVYEMMAENHVIISNRSEGMELEFPEGVWYCGEEAPRDDPAARRRNLERVFLRHTCRRQLERVLDTLHMGGRCPKERVYVFCPDGCDSPGGAEPEHCVLTVRAMRDGQRAPLEERLPRDAYVAVLDRRRPVSTVLWDFVLAQFSYLPPGCGVRLGEGTYEIAADSDNWNCVFPVRVLGEGLELFSACQKKLDL